MTSIKTLTIMSHFYFIQATKTVVSYSLSSPKKSQLFENEAGLPCNVIFSRTSYQWQEMSLWHCGVGYTIHLDPSLPSANKEEFHQFLGSFLCRSWCTPAIIHLHQSTPGCPTLHKLGKIHQKGISSLKALHLLHKKWYTSV